MNLPAPGEADRWTYGGLFLVTLATLALQILLTRIFSVTLWYHFAFLAISLAMLGMTMGAIGVYLFPRVFTLPRIHLHLALGAFAMAVTTILSLLLHLRIPVSVDGSAASVFSMIVLTCSAIAVPFTASGVCVALALTRFPHQVGSLYAADLLGAAAGCVSVLVLLSATDGPTAIFAVAAVASAGALCFARRASSRALLRTAAAATIALSVFVVWHTVRVHQQAPLVRIQWMRTPDGARVIEPPAYEAWNSHSRIRVHGDASRPSSPFGWSLSPAFRSGDPIAQLFLEIDSGALTVLTSFDGDLEPLDYLKYDLTNLAHYLRPDADVLVVGAGGGRDVLSALAFEQRSVVGIEVNANILDVLNRVYGDFTGHLDRLPQVTFVNDEARSWVARSSDRFDIIQISLIDSFAATAAGAFVLTEHSLYTVEAWKLFLSHLKADGVLSVTRFYFAENPGSAYRLTALAGEALKQLGAKVPRDHIALVRMASGISTQPTMVTALVGRQPFSESDLAILQEQTHRLEFEPTLDPHFAENDVFEQIASGEDLSVFFADFPLRIDPPTDDSPFFFHMLRLRDIFDAERREDQGIASFNMRAVFLLGVLLITIFALTLLFIVVPLAVRSRLGDVREVAPWFLIFAGLGVGFMMIEISQMERLVVFLGHPVYALSVVLLALLSASGVGSFSTRRIQGSSLRGALAARLAALLGVVILFGVLTPSIVGALEGSTTPVRIAVSVIVLLPLGFFMGMPFPLGMRLAAETEGARDLTPWLWGINGTMSVLASVLAIIVAMTAGISTSYWVGFGSYVVATLGFAWAGRSVQKLHP